MDDVGPLGFARELLKATPSYGFSRDPESIISAAMQCALTTWHLKGEELGSSRFAELMVAVAVVANEELASAYREQMLEPSTN